MSDTISDHDKAVLNSIFNPNLPLGTAETDDALPATLQDVEDASIANLDEIKHLELLGVQTAEAGKYDEAIKKLTQSIELAPNRPSAYNNRAQVYRLRGNIPAALEDIAKTIAVSGGRGRSCCQALCQRGILRRKEHNDDEARFDFQIAAKMGSQFAKSQLVEMNPYAALCNAMLKKVMADLK